MAIEGNNLVLAKNIVLLYQKKGRDPRLSHVDAGVLFSRFSIFDYITESDGKKFTMEEDVWHRIISQKKMSAFEVDHQPYDIGTPERLSRFENFLRNRIR